MDLAGRLEPLRRRHVDAPARRAARRQVRHARGRARHAARPGQGDVSVRHVVEPGRRVRARLSRVRSEGGRPRGRHREGVRHAGRRRAVPDGGPRRRRRAPRGARPGVRHRDRAQAPLRLVRRRAPALRGPGERSDRAVRHEARRAVRVRARSGSAPAIASTETTSTTSRRTSPSSTRPSRSTRSSTAGWRRSTRRTTFEDLPKAAREYVHRIEELAEVPVSVVSVGPAREQSLPIG